VDLFPSDVLARFGTAARDSGHTRSLAHPDEREDPDRERREVGARVGDWIGDDLATRRTQAGQVSSTWRQVERELVQSFHPPVAVVHDLPGRAADRVGERLKTLLRQAVAVTARGEAGVRREVVPGEQMPENAPFRAADPSQQGFVGTPEGANMRAGPLEQQQAVMGAMGEPVSWLRTEIEVLVDGDGRVEEAKVVLPSGRRKFDRYALDAVTARVTGVREAARTCWIIEAAYSVAPLNAFGATFDITMLTDGRMREQFAPVHPLKDMVTTHVSLKWSRPHDGP
jgi:hypothetical protein